MDKRHFSECAEQYDGLAISAHMLAHYANSFSAFQSSMNKPYFIDPETFALQIAPLDHFIGSKGGIRASWRKLGKWYGSSFAEALGTGLNTRHLRIADFMTPSGALEPTVSELVERVMSFQAKAIRTTISGLSFFLRERPSTEGGLLFLVAPYFFFESPTDQWYRITLEMARRAANFRNENPVYAAICTTKQVLTNDESVEIIAKDFDIEGLDGFLLWIDNMKEEEQSGAILSNFLKLVRYLSSRHRKVINMYGGYFSVLARFWGMSAHVSGVCYRDSRSVSELPIRGGPPGGPIPRFYIPKLHTKVTKDDAQRILQQFPELQCDCPVCRHNRNVYEPEAERPFARFIMNRHFLYHRKKEREEAIEANFGRLFDSLNEEYRRYENFRTMLPVSHLAEWYSAIRNSASCAY